MYNAAPKSHPDTASTAALAALGAAVAISMVGCSGASGTPSATAQSATAMPAIPGHHHGATDHNLHGIIGHISTENGSTWTVTAPDGTPYSVSLTPDTHFGTPQTPRTAQQFPVGATVHVTGPVTDHTITAILITPSGHSR